MNKYLGIKKLGKKIAPLFIISSLVFSSKVSDKVQITSNQAIEIAKKHSNFSDNATVEAKLEDNKYEIKVNELNKELEYEVDAYSGKIIKFSQEDIYRFSYLHNPSNQRTYENKPFLSKDEIKKIALSKVKGATENDIYKFKTDINNDILVYEIIIVYDGVRYEFDLNPQSAEVIEWEEETIGK